ncbi:glycosyltransferase family 2 protein [Lachnobacterium bovis]|uniref:glycosyltransferase family 2 protein n=1 Tax=Lachnobacterium bovis TaxID=140626 RepID=UPI0004875D85|nr:glycosyltransferase [Lachnobacterium bovis]
MENKVCVSIILPIYERSENLSKCIDSILTQTYPNFELLLIDALNDENDSYFSTLQNYLNKDSRLKYIKTNTEQTYASACNVGISQVQNDYIAFANPNEKWRSNKLLLQIACINDDYPVCYSSSSLTTTNDLNSRNLNGDIFKILLSNKNFISLSTMMIKKECFDVVGSLSTKYKIFYDYELVLRLAQIYKFTYIDQELQVALSELSYELEDYYSEYLSVFEEYAPIIDTLNMFDVFANCIISQAKNDGIEEVVSENIKEIRIFNGIHDFENKSDNTPYKVSIIMSCLNDESVLNTALTSITRQTLDMINLQVILIDQGSDDSTLDILDAFEKKYPFNCILIKDEYMLEKSTALNLALDYIKGEYVLFLEPKDSLSPNTCEDLYNLAQDKALDMIQACYYKNTDGTLEIVNPCDIEGLIELNETNRLNILINQPFTCDLIGKFFRSHYIKQHNIQFATTKISYEYKFVYSYFIFGNNVAIIDLPYYQVNGNDDSVIEIDPIDLANSQLQLLYYLKAKNEYRLYYPEIEFNFFVNFYLNTIYATKDYDFIIDTYDYEWLRNTLLNEMPNWQRNNYIMDNPFFSSIFKALHTSFLNSPNLQMKYLEKIRNEFSSLL